ncbi:MAG: hypothetical protein V3T84_06795 [Phycisphaerales bacterium]
MSDRLPQPRQTASWSPVTRLLSSVSLAVLSGGCEAPPARQSGPTAPPWTVPTSTIPGPGADLPAELNSARAAAMAVVMMPPVSDAWSRREILLHAALYEAAYHTRLADAAERFLLDEAEAAPIDLLPITRREFRLRVLSALAGLGFPVAWARWESDPPGRSYEPFPHAREPATHLGFRVIERIDEQATIIAEVSAHTPGRRSARRRVTCIWDGAEWSVTARGLRMVW